MTKLVKYNIPLFCLKYKSKWRKSDKKPAPSAGMPATPCEESGYGGRAVSYLGINVGQGLSRPG